MNFTDKSNDELLSELKELRIAYDLLKAQCDNGLAIIQEAEAKARLSEDKFMKAFMTSPDSVNINRLSDGMYVSVNEGFVKMMGFSEEEVIGKTSLELNIWVEPESRKKLVTILHNEGRIENYETLFRHKDGRIIIGLMSASVIDLDGIPHTINITKDITGRKQIEEQFLLLANALKGINECVSITDMNDRVLFLNQAFLETYGFNEEDLADESISLIRSPNNPPEVINEILPATIRGGWHGEIFNCKKDGSEFLIELSTAVVKNENGEPIALIGIASDISKRKRIETENKVLYEINQGITFTSNLDELLKLIHQSLERVVYAENFFVALFDERTGLFSFPYFVDKYDTTPLPTSMGKSCSAYVFRTVRPFLFNQQEFDRLEKLNEVELVGSASPSWIGVPLQTPSKVLGVMVLQHYEKENVFSGEDMKFLISIGGQIAFAIERKQAELALKESERDLNESQKIAGLGSYNLDFKTGTWDSSKILDSIFGIDENYDRSVKGWTDLIHPDWREKMSNYFQQDVIGKRLSFDKEYEIVRRSDGLVRWVHGRGELIFGQDGELISILGNIIDITSRKLAEDEIKLKNELLQKVNSEKDKFFSILAHDLRSPLSAFVAATQIITDEIHTMSIEEIKDITLSMKNSATGIYSLLENLLEWSRLQRGVMDFIPSGINLKKKVNECISVLSEASSKKRIIIEVLIEDDMEAKADKNMFDAIMRNLISNALKFTKPGGKVSISAINGKDNSVEIKVSDTGIGMTPELKNKLFRIDEKTSRPGTDGEPSTGLGLLLCKEFVEKHGGKIWAESEVGKGTTFSFILP